jgi:hypothetical protein
MELSILRLLSTVEALLYLYQYPTNYLIANALGHPLLSTRAKKCQVMLAKQGDIYRHGCGDSIWIAYDILLPLLYLC